MFKACTPNPDPLPPTVVTPTPTLPTLGAAMASSTPSPIGQNENLDLDHHFQAVSLDLRDRLKRPPTTTQERRLPFSQVQNF